MNNPKVLQLPPLFTNIERERGREREVMRVPPELLLHSVWYVASPACHPPYMYLNFNCVPFSCNCLQDSIFSLKEAFVVMLK